MTKKQYSEPTMKVVELKYKHHILVGSLMDAKSTGLGDNEELDYSDSGGAPSNAW